MSGASGKETEAASTTSPCSRDEKKKEDKGKKTSEERVEMKEIKKWEPKLS